MPGVLIVEAMAQTAAALVMLTLNLSSDKLVYFMSINKANFRKPVCPGDTLRIKIQKRHHRGPVWKFYAQAFVQDQVMADATYTAMISES